MTFFVVCILLVQAYVVGAAPSAVSPKSVKKVDTEMSRLPIPFSAKDSEVTDECLELGEFCKENAQTVLNGCYEYMRMGCCCKIWQSGEETCLKPCTCPEECPPAPDGTLPHSAWVGGDPHIHSFDNLFYDCQACGDFTMSMKPDCPKYEIQSHFFIPTASSSVSLVSSAVFSHENAPTIQVGFIRKLSTNHAQYRNGTCKVAFFVNGVNQVIDPDTTTTFGTSTVTTTQSSVTITMPSEIEMIFGINYAGAFCFGSVQELLPNTIAPDGIVGLFGTPNSPLDITDDWMTPMGTMIPLPGPPITDEDGEDYCTANWKVPTAASSHFTYEAGITFANSQDCTGGDWNGVATRMSAEDIKPGVHAFRQVARICRGAVDVGECELDGMNLGEEGAKAYVESTTAASRAFKSFAARF